MIQQAVASGQRTAFTEDLATIEDIEKIKSQVTLQYLMGSEINENHRIITKDTQWIYRLIKCVIDELVNQLDKAVKLSDIAQFKEAP